MTRSTQPPRAPARPGHALGWIVGVTGALVLAGLLAAVLVYWLVVSQLGRALGGAQGEAVVASPTPTSTSTAFSSEGLDLSNDAYRQRAGGPEDHPGALAAVPDVEAVLAPLAQTEGAVAASDVVAAVEELGYDGVQIVERNASGDPTDAVGFGFTAVDGCVYGSVGPHGRLDVQAGGGIADGGCIEMPSH